eukprot:TRINITY_DN67531_c3_g1_i1.p1 TRINITY_DN67531_c3_g1~~TRINITY_DN67531_c3_g1_i1.p1  ORF type:complete len:108 (+),score=0.78 TRINITY_DN67531_c3_g1_i1:332-655(+)
MSKLIKKDEYCFAALSSSSAVDCASNSCETVSGILDTCYNNTYFSSRCTELYLNAYADCTGPGPSLQMPGCSPIKTSYSGNSAVGTRLFLAYLPGYVAISYAALYSQ